jgi:hypothetical protein
MLLQSGRPHVVDGYNGLLGQQHAHEEEEEAAEQEQGVIVGVRTRPPSSGRSETSRRLAHVLLRSLKIEHRPRLTGEGAPNCGREG